MTIIPLTSKLLLVSLFFQSITPGFTMETTAHLQNNSPAPLTVLGDKKTTAAGILHYALHNGEIHVLLGKRIDEEEWCNFGGQSERQKTNEDQDNDHQTHEDYNGTLSEDASRESAEESNGMYSTHPRLVRHLPFTDFLTLKENNNFLYRMYWEKIKYVDPQILIDKLENATNYSCKEYTDFKWVKASDLLRAVLPPDAQNPRLENLGIYTPLLKMLSTPSGVAFLNELAHHQKLNRHKKHIRPFCNRLYIDENSQENHTFQYESNPFSDRDIFAEAVATHGMAMVQLKKLFNPPNPVTASLSDRWNPDCDETLTRIHLRIVLGNAYQEAIDFFSHENAERGADIANLKTYYALYNDAEYHQKHGDNERKVKLQDSDYEILADALEFETKNRQWPTGYHGAHEGINNLIKSNTSLRELMSLQSLQELAALRGTDIYFKKYTCMKEMLEANNYAENKETTAAMLYLNVVLTAALETSNSSSNSPEYLTNDHSVQEQNVQERFEEAMALAGFAKPVYTYYQSLFEQYFKYQHPQFPNSVLIAVSQNPQYLDAYNYAVPFRLNLSRETTPSVVYHNIQKEFERLKANFNGESEPFSINTNHKKGLFPENRFYLAPHHALDLDTTRIQCFDRFPLSPTEQATYDHKIAQTTIAFLADWLAQNTAVTEGSFETYPALKTLYRIAYPYAMLDPFIEKSSHQGLNYHIVNENWEAVDTYLETYPNALSELDKSAEKLFIHFLEKESLQGMKWILERFPHCDIQKVAQAKNQSQETALCLAVRNKDIQLMKVLINHGADINYTYIKDSNTDKAEDVCPLKIAMSLGHIQEIKLLLSCNHINVDFIKTDKEFNLLEILRRPYLRPILEMLLQHPAIDVHGSIARTSPIIYALSNHSLPITLIREMIHHHSFDPNRKDTAGEPIFQTLIHPTSTYCVPSLLRNQEVFQLVITHPHFDPNTINKTGVPLLHLAISRVLTSVIKLLLEHPKCNPNILDQHGNTALHGATTLSMIKKMPGSIAELILSHPLVNPNIPNKAGVTPLDQAIIDRNIDAATLIIEHPKFDPNFINPLGNTALHLAITFNRKRITYSLLQHPGLDPCLLNTSGFSPLQLADHPEMLNVARAIKAHKNYREAQ